MEPIEYENATVSSLLIAWGMHPDIVKKFEEENVDIEALRNLLLDDLRVLIPSIGFRTKFRVCWLAWKEKLHALEDETSSTTIATAAAPASSATSCTSRSSATKKSSSEHSVASEQTTRYSVTEVDAEDTCARSNPLKQLLNGNVRLKSLLTSTRLTKAERCSLARCIVSHLIETTPGSILKPPQIDQWAQYVIDLFPQEEKKFYYFSVGNNSSSNESSGSRQLPSKSRRYYGCLWEHWNNERKKMRSKNVIPFTSKKSSGHSSSVSSEITTLDADQVNDSVHCLKIVEDFQGDEISEYLQEAWKKSRQQRRSFLANQEYTVEYLKKFPVLKNQEIASHLIDIDFRECSPLENSDIALAEVLQKYEQAVISKAKERYSKLRAKTQRAVLDNIFKCIQGSGGETAAVLVLLPFLFSSGGKVNSKGQKASRAEAARKFILLCNSLADGEEIILQQRKQCECAKLFGSAENEISMHSSEPPPAPPASGPDLLRQLGRLITRARSASPAPRRLHAKLLAAKPSTSQQLGRLITRARSASPVPRRLYAKLLVAKPSTSQQVQTQNPVTDEPRPGDDALSDHVNALWNEQIPICIEVLLAPDCADCYQALSRVEEDSSFDRQHTQQRALLLERWSMRALVSKPHESPAFITSQWLLNAVRSQLHFSQLSAWLARLKGSEEPERRRKLSREKCNYKKLESNCEDTDELRKLNIVYSIKIPGESYKMAEFTKPPTDHTFPITDIGNNVYLKVTLQSLPRIDEVPTVKCSCPPKRRASKEVPVNLHEELVGKLNDLTIGPRGSKFSPDLEVINQNTGPSHRRLSITTEYLYSEKKVVDDRMHTPCSENGKHKCECDDSDGNHRSSTSLSQEPKKLDERRLKEIAKYKRRLRKESKLSKLCDSTSSEGDGLNSQKSKETHTSIPILQAARFDRFRAIGCYRNQTYLTLPASRIETKSPFIETDIIPPAEFKKTNTVATQTDEVTCDCGNPVMDKCEVCIDRGMVRSEGNYNLASIDQSEVLLDAINRCKENGARRKREYDDKSLKKHKCDNFNIKCDINSIDDSYSLKEVVRRPKMRRFFPIADKIEKIVSDRLAQNPETKDMEELHLKDDDTVFSKPKESKRQKTYSINDDDYVCYEKCDYGTFDRCEVDSPNDSDSGFVYPDPGKVPDTQVPSPTEMDRFRWRFDSAASMVFHTKTGLPLTSSPAPLRRGNNCFDFDDSINGISGIKSALFHPVPTAPPAPRPPPPPPPPPKLRIGPSTGLLGSFEESALKGRLEPVATVHGFTAELGASGAFCPPHKRLPVTVFFYAPGGTNAPYMGHINLGPSGYRVARSGTIQVSLFNPHGTLVKMFVVLYDLTSMPPLARTFLRQRTLYMPCGAAAPAPRQVHKWLRYLIHLRFMTSKSGKLYLHTDIRILVSRKADLDTATAHTAIFKPIAKPANEDDEISTNRTPNRVFGGCAEFDSEIRNVKEIGYENQNVSYELRSFTYAPENPKYSPR